MPVLVENACLESSQMLEGNQETGPVVKKKRRGRANFHCNFFLEMKNSGCVDLFIATFSDFPFLETLARKRERYIYKIHLFCVPPVWGQ